MKFMEWLKKRDAELAEALMQTAQPNQPTTNPTLQGIPSALSAKLQALGPSMSNVLNRANQLMAAGTHRSLTQALHGAMGEYDSQKQTGQASTPPIKPTPQY